MAADYLYLAANQLLQNALTGLSEVRTGVAPPGRVFVVHGEPVAEGCDQLTVHLDPALPVESRPRPLSGIGTPGGNQCQIYPVATFVITLFRCAGESRVGDSGTPPDVVALSGLARQLMIDLWALQTELYARREDGTILPGGTCAGVAFRAARAYGPQGLVAGWRLPIEMLLSDGGP